MCSLSGYTILISLYLCTLNYIDRNELIKICNAPQSGSLMVLKTESRYLYVGHVNSDIIKDNLAKQESDVDGTLSIMVTKKHLTRFAEFHLSNSFPHSFAKHVFSHENFLVLFGLHSFDRTNPWI